MYSSEENFDQEFDMNLSTEKPDPDYKPIVMHSEGVTPMDSPDYVEDDDVENSIAEGYF